MNLLRLFTLTCITGLAFAAPTKTEDVAAGKATSGAVKLRQLVSKGSGGQEKPKRPAMPADGKGDSTPPK
jgi:hypothetical protein